VDKVEQVLQPCGVRLEIVIIDDGSRDATFATASELVEEGRPVRALHFSRNFGKESAILAGLEAAQGDAIITIDADLQHPPELMAAMVERWRAGVKVVHAVKRRRDTDSAFARARAAMFNNLFRRAIKIDLRDASDFKLLDREAARVLVERLPERSRFYRALAVWIGFPQETLTFDVAPRFAGSSNWSIKSLIGLALTAIVSFTSAPLRIVTVLGMITLVFAAAVGAEAVWSWARGEAISGFATLIITVLLIGSFIMISLGILGEYVAKIYDEVKRRPRYIVDVERSAPSVSVDAATRLRAGSAQR
jgi:glycosyltransferase involved in cell wall biosynthesis